MKKRIENCVELARLHEFFVCDPIAGLLFWRHRQETCYRVSTWNKRFAGKPAGRRLQKGYIQIVVRIDGVRYHVTAQRLIWAMATGAWIDTALEVDHRNGNRGDNRFPNLRVCLPSANIKNKGLYRNNTSGFKGVSWVARYNKWGVQIHVDGHSRFKGYYDSALDAAAAYDQAAHEHFGDFARSNADMGLLAA